MIRTDLINKIIATFKYKTYLEIGVRDGRNLKHIKIPTKTGVDPDRTSAAPLKLTSDEFFSRTTDKFDCIFIDGLHEAPQVSRDIENSLRVLNPGGTIVCHDIYPTTEIMQRIPRDGQVTWTGDCWRAWLQYRRARADLHMQAIAAETGIGVIRVGTQPLLSIPEVSTLTYADFEANARSWLSPVTLDEFNDWLVAANRP